MKFLFFLIISKFKKLIETTQIIVRNSAEVVEKEKNDNDMIIILKTNVFYLFFSSGNAIAMDCVFSSIFAKNLQFRKKKIIRIFSCTFLSHLNK